MDMFFCSFLLGLFSDSYQSPDWGGGHILWLSFDKLLQCSLRVMLKGVPCLYHGGPLQCGIFLALVGGTPFDYRCGGMFQICSCFELFLEIIIVQDACTGLYIGPRCSYFVMFDDDL